MSEEFLKTQIISPDNQVYDGNTEMVVLPGDEGDFAAMYEHAPIITFLRPGKVEVFSKEEKEKITFFVGGGFVKIQNNNCLVMVDYIKKTTDIDVKENEKKISELSLKLEKAEDEIIRDKAMDVLKFLKIEHLKNERAGNRLFQKGGQGQRKACKTDFQRISNIKSANRKPRKNIYEERIKQNNF